MPGKLDLRQQLEQELLRRLQHSEEVYHDAVNRARELVDRARSAGWDAPDGGMLYRAVKKENEAIKAYNELLRAFTELVLHDRKPCLALLLEHLLDEAMDAAGADRAAIHVLDPEDDALKLVVQRGFERTYLERFASVPEKRCACAKELHAGRRVVVEDLVDSALFRETECAEALLESGVRALRVEPAWSSWGTLLGVVSTYYKEPQKLPERKPALISVAGRASVCIEVLRSDP